MRSESSPTMPNAPVSGLRKLAVPLCVLLMTAATAGAAFLATQNGGRSGSGRAPSVRVKLVKSYPHDTGAFIQGLVMHKGRLLEGTGQYNESRLRLVDIATGTPVYQIDLPGNVFGEGVTVWNDRIIQLTWKNGYLITYDANTFRQTGTVVLRQIDRTLEEGWGITHDGQNLIISDGSPTLRFLDPVTFRMVRKVYVKEGRRALSRLNELEFVNGEIFANVWYQDRIARIDPVSGQVKGWLDVSALRPASVRNDKEAALNGIAWDAVGKRLYVTGKNWPVMLHVSY